MADHITPTYAAGTISVVSAGNKAFINDSVAPGQPNGYQNQVDDDTVGSFNSNWANGCLSQSVAPTYGSSGLLSFGSTGRQS